MNSYEQYSFWGKKEILPLILPLKIRLVVSGVGLALFSNNKPDTSVSGMKNILQR